MKLISCTRFRWVIVHAFLCWFNCATHNARELIRLNINDCCKSPAWNGNMMKLIKLLILFDSRFIRKKTQKELCGQSLLEVVFARLNLLETSYFGLRFLDLEGQTVRECEELTVDGTTQLIKSWTFISQTALARREPTSLATAQRRKRHLRIVFLS